MSMLAAALLLAACKPTAPQAPAKPAEAATATPAATADAPKAGKPAASDAHDNLNAVAWVQRSAEYAAVTTTISSTP